MNVVDTLVVTLGLDTAGLKQGAKDATATTTRLTTDLVSQADRGEKAQSGALANVAKAWNGLIGTQRKAADAAVVTGKTMVGATERVADSGEKAIRTFGALFLLLAGGSSLKNFASSMIALDASVGRLAHNTGTTTEVISGLGRAAERMGGTFEGATGGLRGLSDAYQDLRLSGNNAIMEPLAKLQGLSGKVITFGKDAHANLLSIADALHVLEAKGETALADRLGRQILGDEGLANIAKGGSAAVRAAEAASPKTTAKQAEDAQKLQAQLAAVHQGFQDIGNAILLDFGPTMIQAAKVVKDLVAEYGPLLKTKVDKWVKEVGVWFREHKGDVQAFGTAIGQLATAAGALATAFMSQSPMMMALEAFVALLGGRVLSTIGLVSSALTALGALPVPAALAAAIGLPLLGTAAVGAVLASGDPEKSVLAGGRPDVQPQDNDLGLPGTGLPNDNRPNDTSRPQGVWDWIKNNYKPDFGKAGEQFKAFLKVTGFGDRLHEDPKTKENIADTARSTKDIRDLVKNGASLTGNAPGFNGVTASSGGLGGSGEHFGGSTSPGAILGDRARGVRGAGGPSALKSQSQKDNAAAIKDELQKAGLPLEGIAGALGSAQTESGLNPAVPENSYNHGHHGLWQWDSNRWPKIEAWIRSRSGDPMDARWQAKAFVAEGRAMPGDPIYDGPQTRSGFAKLEGSTGNLGMAVEGMRGIERFGRGEEGGRAAHASRWLDSMRGGGGSAPTGDAAGLALSMQGMGEGESAKALGHIMHAGEWCADFMNGVIERSGGKGSGSAMARSFMHWGKAVGLGEVKRGDVAVLNGGGHVGFFTGERQADGRLGVIAGNTRDGHGGHDVEHYFVDPRSVLGARRGAEAAAATAASPGHTYGHAIRHVLGVMAKAQRLTQHSNDNHPVSVEITDKSAERIGKSGWEMLHDRRWGAHGAHVNHALARSHAAAYGSMLKIAEAGRYAASTTHNVNRNVSSETHIGSIAVHTNATDARGIVADIEPHLRRGQAAVKGDYGYA